MGAWCRALIVALVVLATMPARAATAVAASAGHPADPALSVDSAAVHAAMECRGPSGGGGREPVLLVHGTLMTGSQAYGWNYLPGLAARGYRVCTLDLPERSLGDIQHAAELVVVAVHRLARESGRKVDVLGHSQGVLEARWAVRWWPSVQAEVDDLVSLAGPNQGTTVPLGGLVPPTGCPACAQMAPGSAFLTALNGGDQTPGPVSVTSLYSTLVDELIAPNATAARVEGAANIELQALCSSRVVTHGSIVVDAAAFALVLDAFGHAGGAAASRFDRATCRQTTFVALPAALRLDVLLQPIAVPAVADRTAEPPLKPYARPGAAPPATANAATPGPSPVVAPPAAPAAREPASLAPVAAGPPGSSATTSPEPTSSAGTAAQQEQQQLVLPARPAGVRRTDSGAGAALVAGFALVLVTMAGGVTARRRHRAGARGHGR